MRVLLVDLANSDSFQAAIDAQLGPGGLSGLDGLIHVAGVSERSVVGEAPASLWRHQFEVNVVAPAELTRLALPELRAAGGTIVFVNSIVALRQGGVGGASYAASKAALRALADGVRVEEPGIRVVSLFPGRVATQMQEALRRYEQQPYRSDEYLGPAAVAAVIEQVLCAPLGVELSEVSLVPRAVAE